MKIGVLVSPKFPRTTHLDMAIGNLNANQSRFFFQKVLVDDVPTYSTAPQIEPLSSRAAVLVKHRGADNTVVLTDSCFVDNWFSHTSEDGTIISTYGWEEHFAPPGLKTFLELELILHITGKSAHLTDNTMGRLAHDEPIGCLFDFCRQKTDVRYKLVGGNLCGQCEGSLRGFGIGDEGLSTIRHMLHVMRLDGLGRLEPIDDGQVFVAMRFSKNDNNDHSFLYGIKPACASLGLEARRADDMAGMGPNSLISRILSMINRSWLVIVLAGENNLNVFFEYGYALGRGKPIPVVLPKSKIPEAPTDIKGFECVVYEDGDFEGLRKEVVRYISAVPRFSK